MATTNTLRLEVGKKYRTRDGRAAEITREREDVDMRSSWRWGGTLEGSPTTYWRFDGRSLHSGEYPTDLVEEIPDAAPEYRYFRFDSQDRNIHGQDMRWRVAPGARPEACDTHEGVWRTSAHEDAESLETANGLIECDAEGHILGRPESEPEPSIAEDLTPEHRTRIAKLAARIVLADGPILTVDELAGMTVGELVARLESATEIYSF